MNILITVCGRAGSKGVKNKNTREFLGKPLIDYTLAAAKLFADKNAKRYNINICVNSDSKEILAIASRFFWLTAIERPANLARDNSPKIPVIKHSAKYMENRLNKKYDFIIDLDITSPFRKVEDIEKALQKIIEHEEIDLIFSVVESRRNPYFNMVEERNQIIKKVKDSNFVTRQEAPRVYDMNASIYCYRRDSLLDKLDRTPFDGRCGIIKMKDTGILDIDSEEDFILMEILAEYFFKNEYKDIYDYADRLNANASINSDMNPGSKS